jgi:hypothetical protein
MERGAPVPLGHWIAGLGAVGLVITLFQPWYGLNLPEEFLAEAGALAPRMGDFGPLVSQGLAELQRAAPLTVTAWQVFESADIVLAGLAAAVLGAVALGAAGAATSAWIGWLGAAAAALVLFKLASPPFAEPLVKEQLIKPEPALYAALACALAMAAGGKLAARSAG